MNFIIAYACISQIAAMLIIMAFHIKISVLLMILDIILSVLFRICYVLNYTTSLSANLGKYA